MNLDVVAGGLTIAAQQAAAPRPAAQAPAALVVALISPPAHPGRLYVQDWPAYARTIDRLIDSFPPEHHKQMRSQLALVLRGIISLKLVKNKDGKYILPDDRIYDAIYDDIAAHDKTLIAHVADPTTVFEAPNPAAPDYTGYMNQPGFYMYRKPEAPSAAAPAT